MSRIARVGSAILSNFFGMDIKRFKDRMHAGQLLAKRLEAYARRPDAIVLALPRGGVPVGYAVAKALELPLDVMLVRKLGVPGHEELAMGAVASGGQLVLAPDVVQMLGIPDEIIEAAARRELAEIERREKLYRSGRPPLQLQDRVVILVDDGLATGSTMLAAVQAVRTQNPARVVVAVPVGAPDTCRKLSSEADEVICLRTPEPFYAVGLWYENFTQTTDEEVIRLLNEAWQEQASQSGRIAGSQQDHDHLRDGE
jgi:putative phosphoribosyl transferase